MLTCNTGYTLIKVAHSLTGKKGLNSCHLELCVGLLQPYQIMTLSPFPLSQLLEQHTFSQAHGSL